MPKVDPTTNATVDAIVSDLRDWRVINKSSGVASTHKRAFVLNAFLKAVDDPRLTTPFDPSNTYTKLGARGIEIAMVRFDEALHDPAFNWGSGADAATADEQNLVVELVDMQIEYVEQPQYSEVFGLANYEQAWVDENDNYVGDAMEAPVNVTKPTITGTETVGQVLTANTDANADWTGTPDSFTYRWFRGVTVIADANEATYTLTAADEGKKIRVGVVATNSAGDSTEAKSVQTGAIAAA